jgi:hypothetical protein
MFRNSFQASANARSSALANVQHVLAASALLFSLSSGSRLVAQQPLAAIASASEVPTSPALESDSYSTSVASLPDAPGVQTLGEKFHTATEDSFDYSSIFIPLAVAGYDYGRNATPEFGSGGVAYGRYLWHSVVDQTSENYFVEFIVPVLTHEDTRYYSLARGGFIKRAGYSLSRAVITRSDSGKDTFNLSEVIGAGAAAGVSNLYYPRPERTLGNTGSQWGTSIGIDALSFFVKEFSPDITHSVFHAGKIFHRAGSSSN